MAVINCASCGSSAYSSELCSFCHECRAFLDSNNQPILNRLKWFPCSGGWRAFVHHYALVLWPQVNYETLTPELKLTVFPGPSWVISIGDESGFQRAMEEAKNYIDKEEAREKAIQAALAWGEKMFKIAN